MHFHRQAVERGRAMPCKPARLRPNSTAMIGRTSLVLLTLALAAYSQSQSREVVAANPDGGAYPARLPLAGAPLPIEQAPLQPEGGAWAAAATTVSFAVPGQPALLALACTHDATGAANIAITRRTRADEGAKAFLALIGNGRIARLPLDAAMPGEAGEWRGAIPASDPRLDVLKGGNRIEATLPGGGTLMLPASGEPGRLLETCRASDRVS